MKILNTRDMAELRAQVRELEEWCASHHMTFGEFLVLVEELFDIPLTQPAWRRVFDAVNLPRDDQPC